MPVDTSNIDSVIAKINRKYEKNLIHAASTIVNPGFISTGSPELDVAMGGGVPRGRFTRFYGGFGSTKTMTALHCIVVAQKLGLKCVLFNIEKRFDKAFAKRIGIDIDALIVVEGTSIEEIGEKAEALFTVANFFVLDSCSVAVSEDELECDVRDWRPGISARAWGKVFRRLNERFDMLDNTVILIDQVRVDFKTGNENPAGGKIFDHQSSMSVLFSKGKWLYLNEEGILDEDAKRTKGSDGQTTPDGREIKIRIEKSSVCRPFRTATLHYNLDTLEYDRSYEYVKAAKHYGVVVPDPGGAKGRWQYIDGDGDVTKMYGDKQIRKFIEENDELKQYIIDSAFEAIDIEEARRGK
jgi:RecA/RadA recombinase